MICRNSHRKEYILQWLFSTVFGKMLPGRLLPRKIAMRRYETAIIRQYTNITFCSFFEENCQQIINYSLTPRKKPAQNLLQRKKKMPQMNPHPQRVASKE